MKSADSCITMTPIFDTRLLIFLYSHDSDLLKVCYFRVHFQGSPNFVFARIPFIHAWPTSFFHSLYFSYLYTYFRSLCHLRFLCFVCVVSLGNGTARLNYQRHGV